MDFCFDKSIWIGDDHKFIALVSLSEKELFDESAFGKEVKKFALTNQIDIVLGKEVDRSLELAISFILS